MISSYKVSLFSCQLHEQFRIRPPYTTEWTATINDEIKCKALCLSNTLKWFAHGLRDLVMSFIGYIINDLRFHTKEVEKSRQNSGVLVEATTMCRSSARDHTQILKQVAYYGSYMPSIPRNLGGLETIIDNGNKYLNLRVDVEGILCDT
ncbi:hypothetical protein ACOSQ2_028405 [Xanthoceras sorbifolium]